MKALVLIFLIVGTYPAWSNCQIFNSDGVAVDRLEDAHFRLLSQLSDCPQDVFEYKKMLSAANLSSKPTMVANRGRNNPQLGSFSFFEQVTGPEIAIGEFFFGHFTQKSEKDQIDLDQQKNKGQLMIELIAWDTKKQLFNFYELIGQGTSAKWFYRGDSQDILKDNEFLYRTNTPQFGRTLRCSGCHSSGGPIMKELEAPHNDWWTEQRPLTFGQALPSTTIKPWLKDLQDASALSFGVKAGIHKLQSSSTYQNLKAQQSLQEQLRPLFCDTEINIVSSETLFEDTKGSFAISSVAFINPLLIQGSIQFNRVQYDSYTQKYNLQFPETKNSDADHLWLVPVKGYSDLLAIQDLMNKGGVDEKLVKMVLSIDAENSLLSSKRCEVLKSIPNTASSDWKQQLANNIKNLTSTQSMDAYLQKLQHQGLTEDLFIKLMRDRKAVFKAEISKNPMGQILEPGFRVIFPQSTTH